VRAHAEIGGMAERSKAPALKAGRAQALGSSNPSPSAHRRRSSRAHGGYRRRADRYRQQGRSSILRTMSVEVLIVSLMMSS
jgi:hypothetical protein